MMLVFFRLDLLTHCSSSPFGIPVTCVLCLSGSVLNTVQVIALCHVTSRSSDTTYDTPMTLVRNYSVYRRGRERDFDVYRYQQHTTARHTLRW